MVSNLLPQARLPISDDGKTFSLPWLRFFQGLSSGSIDPAVIAALEAEIAAAEAAAAAAQVTADEALALAEEADAGISPSYGIEFAALDEPWRAVNSSVPMSIMMGMDGEPGQDGISIPGQPGTNGVIGRDGAPGIGIPGQDGEPGQDGSMISLPIATATQFGIGRGDGTTIATTNGVNSVIGNPAALVYEDGTVPAGNTIANTVSEIAFTSSYNIPANSLQVGSVIKITMYGVYSLAALAPTLVGKIKIGGTTVLTTGTINTLVGSASNLGWTATANLIVTAIGASGTLECQGLAEFDTAATTGLLVNLTNTAAIGSINTTGTLALTATVTWGTASASNSITLRTMTVEVENIGTVGGGGSGLWSSILSATPTQSSTGLVNFLGTGAASTNIAVGQRIAGTSGGMGAYTSSVPATPYSIVALLAVNATSGVNCIGWTDGTKLQFIYGASGNPPVSIVQSNSSITTFAATNANSSGISNFRLTWLKIRDDGTNVSFAYSNDGITFVTIYTVLKASGYLGSSGYSHIFVGSPGGAGVQDVTILSWTQGS